MNEKDCIEQYEDAIIEELKNEITTKEHKSIFISGNTDLSDKQFIQYYLPILSELVKDENLYFNISDDDGCAEMVQVYLNKVLKDRNKVNIYCIGEKPKHYLSENFLCLSGFKTLEERNAAMTFTSNLDLHIIISGKGRSAIEDNLCRRNEPEYNYLKHYLNGNSRFWQMFFESENLEKEVVNEET